MIPVEIYNVILSDKGFVILLKSSEGNTALPIFVGQLEAQSIIIALSDAPPLRPLTHDLIRSMLDELSCTVIRVEVSDLVEDTFYGKIVLERDGLPIELDSRPSDAIAIAVRTGAPLFVAEHVMKQARITLEPENEQPENQAEQKETAENAKAPESLTVEELKQLLSEAVRQEQYEKASELRDRIRNINTAN
jgi:bifunctional DNase/RNase